MNLKKLTDLELDRMANDDMLEAVNPNLYQAVMAEIEWRSQNDPLDIESAEVMDLRDRLRSDEAEREQSEMAFNAMLEDSWYDAELYMDDMEPMY